MGLADLRGREHETVVRELLASAHGSRRSVDRAIARYRDRKWVLIGWQEDGELVACAGVERADTGHVLLRAVGVVPDRRGEGVGRRLVDAIAEVASASVLVAEADEEAVGFYRRCGFSIEEIGQQGQRVRFRCSRAIEARPAAPSAVHALTLGELQLAIECAWDLDTSDDPDEWSEDNPARGQCVATALLVREILGGEILIANVLRDGERIERHAWNRLPSGLCVDLTRTQFRDGEEFEEPEPGEPILAIHSRHELLAQRVRPLYRPD